MDVCDVDGLTMGTMRGGETLESCRLSDTFGAVADVDDVQAW